MKNKALEWVLRIAIAGEFVGHGVFAIQGKESWFKYFEAVGMTNQDNFVTILLVVGILDILLAIYVLVAKRPFRGVLLWMAIWGLWTALLRWPIGPDPIWDFLERWPNWGAPLALLLYYGWPTNPRQWFGK